MMLLMMLLMIMIIVVIIIKSRHSVPPKASGGVGGRCPGHQEREAQAGVPNDRGSLNNDKTYLYTEGIPKNSYEKVVPPTT